MAKNKTKIIYEWCEGELYTSIVNVIFNLLSTLKDNICFREWKSAFTRIHGNFDTQRKVNVKALEKRFEIDLTSDSNSIFSLIYCLETYYSLILRIIGYKAVFRTHVYDRSIFDYKSFVEKGIENYRCDDVYDLFLDFASIESNLEKVFYLIDIEEFTKGGDMIGFVFESIFPKEIRHSLGEYYTPYWLADFVIDKLAKVDSDIAHKSFIDPSCGSGTFLIALINRYRKESSCGIYDRICGIDINPLTVFAAKTNFLLHYTSDFHIDKSSPLRIPIYHADTISINDPCGSIFGESVSYDKVPLMEYDYIVGNPPWINWEYMPDSYKAAHANLWRYYNLFSRKGLNANFIKEDISVLFVYVVVDKFLKNGGRLGFVVKETLFKSIRQGEGFRNFKIFPSNVDLSVDQVDDLTLVRPFKDAVTRTALLFLEKGKPTSYPVNYIVWHPKTGEKSFDDCLDISKLESLISFDILKARPSVKGVVNSGWITESTEDMEYSKYVLGSNCYTARTGVFTGGANGIFWLNVNGMNENSLVVTNITDRAKNKVKTVSSEVEKDYIFPFLTGNDLSFWNYKYHKYFLCPHTAETRMYPINERELAKLPLTKAYLESFRTELEERKGFTSMDEEIHNMYYYTLQRIGEYTFAPYKVCWRYICKEFTPAVVEYANDRYLGVKNIIGNEKIISIGLNDKDEAYYLCGVISSTLYRKTIENFMVGTQITPSIIKRLYIPKFDRENEMHMSISIHCQLGHLQRDYHYHLCQIDTLVKQMLSNKTTT